MKHLIKIESTPHGVLGVRHAGLDQQYCEAGELVILKWQPDAKWGLQEAHYTDGDGNIVPIDLGNGNGVVAFMMPDKNITVGGTFKKFVLQDWTSGDADNEGKVAGFDSNGNIVPIDYDGINSKPKINGVTLKGDKKSAEFNLRNLDQSIELIGDGDNFVYKETCLDESDRPGVFSIYTSPWDMTDITIPSSYNVASFINFNGFSDDSGIEFFTVRRSQVSTSNTNVFSFYVEHPRRVMLCFRFGRGKTLKIQFIKGGKDEFELIGENLNIAYNKIRCGYMDFRSEIYGSTFNSILGDNTLYSIGVQSMAINAEKVFFSYACVLKSDNDIQRTVVVTCNKNTKRVLATNEVTSSGVTKLHGNNINKMVYNGDLYLYVSALFSPYCIVEKVSGNSFTLQQTIKYVGTKTTSGTYVIDKDNGLIYLYYGSPTMTMLKFNLPSLSQTGDISISDSDIVEEISLNIDSDAGQGSVISNGLLYLGTGMTSGNYGIKVFDLTSKEQKTAIVLSEEPEGIEIINGLLCYCSPLPNIKIFE